MNHVTSFIAFVVLPTTNCVAVDQSADAPLTISFQATCAPAPATCDARQRSLTLTQQPVCNSTRVRSRESSVGDALFAHVAPAKSLVWRRVCAPCAHGQRSRP